MVVYPKPKPAKKEKSKYRFAKKPKKRRPNDALEKEADRIVRQIVLLRDGQICCCPEPKNGHSSVMQAGHLISRTCRSVRWDLWNVHVQCSSCNMIHEHKPERFTKWFILEYGSHRYMELVERSVAVRKISELEMRQLCAGLNSVLVGFQLAQNNGHVLLEEERMLTQEQIINIGKIIIPD